MMQVKQVSNLGNHQPVCTYYKPKEMQYQTRLIIAERASGRRYNIQVFKYDRPCNAHNCYQLMHLLYELSIKHARDKIGDVTRNCALQTVNIFSQ